MKFKIEADTLGGTRYTVNISRPDIDSLDMMQGDVIERLNKFGYLSFNDEHGYGIIIPTGQIKLVTVKEK